MKKSNILWALLPKMAAALMTTACSGDDSTDETTAGQSAAKIIPYTVTVGQDEAAATRATVGADLKTLKFANGDKLYVTGTNIKGVLNMTAGAGTASATFSGNLTYSGSGTPADNLQLTATLVSDQQTVGTQVSVSDAGAVTVNYPTTAYCTDVNDAVQKYSRLTGTSTYGTKSFELSQQTAFLNFVITFEDGTTTGTDLSAVVNNGGAAICTANVTTTTESEKVVAKFVLPVASGTTLSSPTVKVGDKTALTITNATLDGKVYNVNKISTMAANATATDKGKLICTEGHIHAYNADPTCTKARVAMIMYVGNTTTHDDTNNVDYKVLALALEDVSANELSWNASGSNNSSKTAAEWCSDWNTNTSKKVTGGTWMLPSKAQWETMGATGESTTYGTLRDGFSSVGGTNMQSGQYWAYGEIEGYPLAWNYSFTDGTWGGAAKSQSYGMRVRACLAF